MNDVILVAVNDSAAGFAATDVAIDYARRLGDSLHAVCVVEPLSGDLKADDALRQRREADADSLLEHVARRGAHAGVEFTLHRRNGAIAAEILAAAKELDAHLLVLALVDRPSHTTPYIGSHTLRVLEFATAPVLVVPVLSSRQ